MLCTSRDIPRSFGLAQEKTASDGILRSAIGLSGNILNDSDDAFFWLDSGCNYVEAPDLNGRTFDIDIFNRTLAEFEPGHPMRRMTAKERICFFSVTDEGTPPQYQDFFSRNDLEHELQFVFYQGDMPVASYNAVRPTGDRCFSQMTIAWEQLYEHLDAIVSSHWRIRSTALEMTLRQRFQLQPRELDVTDLIMWGKTNADIADLLGIHVSTVKVHVANILRKLGAENRLALACQISRLTQAA